MLKTIILSIFICAIVVGMLTTLFKKEYKALVISEIQERSFYDTIISVWYYKDDSGPGTATLLNTNDTPFCFTGTSHDTFNRLYLGFAKKGDILIKNRFSDTFQIKRADSVFTFDLTTCEQYSAKTKDK